MRISDWSSDVCSSDLRAVAAVTGLAELQVSALVDDWMNRRPLPLLMKARFPGVERLFHAIRASGRGIGVLSDYPAVAKLEALGLAADFIVAAADDGVGVLKPSRSEEHTSELQSLMRTSYAVFGMT